MEKIIEKWPTKVVFPNVDYKKISEYFVDNLVINKGTLDDLLQDIQDNNSSPLFKKMLAELQKTGEFSEQLVDEFFCNPTVIKAYIVISNFNFRISMKDFNYLCTKIDKNYEYDYAKTITTIMLLGGSADEMEVCPIVENQFIKENMKEIKIKQLRPLETCDIKIKHQYNSVDIHISESVAMYLIIEFIAGANFAMQHFENEEFFSKIDKLSANNHINLTHGEFVYFTNLLFENDMDTALGLTLLRYANLFIETNKLLKYKNVIVTANFLLENKDNDINEIYSKLDTLALPTSDERKIDEIINNIREVEQSIEVELLEEYSGLILANKLLRDRVISYYNSSSHSTEILPSIKALLISVVLDMENCDDETIEVIVWPKFMNTMYILAKCEENQLPEEINLVVISIVDNLLYNTQEDLEFKDYMNTMFEKDNISLRV